MTEEASPAPRSLLRLLLGRRLRNREAGERKIGAFEGVPAMGLDGLGSSAYGPEAALTILIPLGAAGLQAIGPITAALVALLAILYLSYRQTIGAYPSNGGAYIVSRENLGRLPSLVAAAGLMIDYVLNVAVGISAGVGALTSALPSLHPWTLPLCLVLLALVTLVNLRGTLDAGRLFALPTYLFVASFAIVIGLGLWRFVASGGAPDPVVPPPPLAPATEAMTVWLLLRAFANGCTAMTGVEAVSNGMSAFKDPPVRHGRRTLTAIVLILGALLAGIATLASAYGIGATDQAREGYQSVLSQLAGAVVGHGWFYYVAMGSLLCVLALSANTSFVDFPRLCHVVAQDGFLPRSFAAAGRRLVFTVGILYLAIAAAGLLIVFGGITEHLIPLFAIGAFLTFTMSQSGMVVHWLRRRRSAEAGRRDGLHLAINAAGVTVTAATLCIILVAKFHEGAWITLVAIPAAIALLLAIRRYYDDLAASLATEGPVALGRVQPPVVLVAIADWNRLTEKSVRFALSLSPDVIALHATALEGPEAEQRTSDLRRQWDETVARPAEQAGFPPPRLMVVEGAYRTIHDPILRLVRELATLDGDRGVAVLLPSVARTRWYQHLLHTTRMFRLRRRLLQEDDPRLVVVEVPWHLDVVAPRAAAR